MIFTFAKPFQNILDWCTQQWVVWSGTKFVPEQTPWLKTPMGKPKVTGRDYIQALCDKEGLYISPTSKHQGLITDFSNLQLDEEQLTKLPKIIRDFYEKTASFELDLSVHWSPWFIPFNFLVKTLFSNRVQQLNIPYSYSKSTDVLNNEIIHLHNKETNSLERVFWFRTLGPKKTIVYAGIYSSCRLKSGRTSIQAVFPLPNGNATVLLSPKVTDQGKFVLTAKGNKFGDPGFYFTLQDAQGNYWAKYIPSFKDELIMEALHDEIIAHQKFSLWGYEVLTLRYNIYQSIGKNPPSK